MSPLKERPRYQSMLITLPIAVIGAFALLFIVIAPIDWGMLP